MHSVSRGAVDRIETPNPLLRFLLSWQLGWLEEEAGWDGGVQVIDKLSAPYSFHWCSQTPRVQYCLCVLSTVIAGSRGYKCETQRQKEMERREEKGERMHMRRDRQK